MKRGVGKSGVSSADFRGQSLPLNQKRRKDGEDEDESETEKRDHSDPVRVGVTYFDRERPGRRKREGEEDGK